MEREIRSMKVVETIAVLMASCVVARGIFLLRKASGEPDAYEQWCKQPNELEVVK